jgi:hypothetical protein
VRLSEQPIARMKILTFLLLFFAATAEAHSDPNCTFGQTNIFEVKDWRVESAVRSDGAKGTRLTLTFRNSLKNGVDRAAATVTFPQILQDNFFDPYVSMRARKQKTVVEEYFGTGIDLVLKKENERKADEPRMTLVICLQAVLLSNGKSKVFDGEPGILEMLKGLP